MGDNKEHGKSASDRVPLIVAVFVPIILAVLTLVGTLGSAMISQWDKLFPQKPLKQASSKSNKVIAPSIASGAHSLHPSVTTLKTKGPLFIVASPDAEGASIGARITDELQKEGFRIAKSRDDAKLLVEIQAPNLGSTQASQVGSLEGFSVTATLTAKMLSMNNSTGDVLPMQRQALGLGATEIEARQNSVASVTDRLGKSIADTLQ